jgi:hypothetical protein
VRGNAVLKLRIAVSVASAAVADPSVRISTRVGTLKLRHPFGLEAFIRSVRSRFTARCVPVVPLITRFIRSSAHCTPATVVWLLKLKSMNAFVSKWIRPTRESVAALGPTANGSRATTALRKSHCRRKSAG